MQTLLRWFDRVLDAMACLAGAVLVFIMASVGLEVIMRYFFNRPLMWVTEVTECLLLYITFLGSAWLLREEGHVRMDILLNRLGTRAKAILGIFSSLIGVFVSATIMIYGLAVTWNYFQRGIYTPTAMEIPLYAILLVIPVGSLMLLLQFLRRTATAVAGLLMEAER